MNLTAKSGALLRVVLTLAGIFCAHSAVTSAIADDARRARGATLFAENCAYCHGEKGEGVSDIYAQPLTGDRSIKELSHYLHTSMPDGSPEDVEGDDAAAVAEFIYDAFYSPVAQVRIAPPKVLFSRLTARQMQQSIPDAINFHRTMNWLDDKRGITGRYYNSKFFKKEKQIAERNDATIDFTFATDAPDKEKFDEDDFSVNWFAGLIAPTTGHYRFRIETTGSFEFEVNNSNDEKLIDRRVKSGDDTEFEASTYLVAGQVYPIRIELSHGRADDAYLRAFWTTPGGVSELIPQRALVPGWFNYMPVVETSFPADDASTGYPRGDSISIEWAQAAAKAAVEASDLVTENIKHFAKVHWKAKPEEREKSIREYAFELARVAYRRPLTPEEQEEIRVLLDGQPIDAAIKSVALKVFASPKFLYREINRGAFDDHAAASWISYAMWDSVPDKRLRDAADKNQLRDVKHFRQRASQALGDPRAKAKLRDFFMTWLQTDRFHGMAKNGKLYPEFDEQVIADLHTSLELFIDDVVWGDNPDFRRLLRSRELYLNKRLADIYAGGNWDPNQADDEQFAKVEIDGEPRAGILSHPYLMAGFSHDKTTSPIHRGVFMSRSVLGRMLKVPTAAISPLSPELQPELTTRERVHLQTDSTTCMSCHSLINPLGFAFENFDAVGKFRATENNKPVDASGTYLTSSGDEVQFENVAQLADWVAESDEARAAFVSHMFHYTIKQPIFAFGGLEYRDSLVEFFKKNNHDIRKLWVEIVATSAERMMKMSQQDAGLAKR